MNLPEHKKKVIREIRSDLGSGKQTNRLLQGDVGSGKTLVALMSMLIALDNGFQACMMAPTAILAQQHFETISEFLDGLNINVDILTYAGNLESLVEVENNPRYYFEQVDICN